MRRERAARILELDAAVTEAMKALKERGFESPYLRPFVVARINPIRFKRGPADADETIETMLAAAGDSTRDGYGRPGRQGGRAPRSRSPGSVRFLLPPSPSACPTVRCPPPAFILSSSSESGDRTMLRHYLTASLTLAAALGLVSSACKSPRFRRRGMPRLADSAAVYEKESAHVPEGGRDPEPPGTGVGPVRPRPRRLVRGQHQRHADPEGQQRIHQPAPA